MKQYDIRQVSAHHPDSQLLRDELSQTLEQIVGNPGQNSFSNWRDEDPKHIFVVAYDANRPVGCGGIREIEPGIGEIKRMFARPGTKGVGHAILRILEETAHTFEMNLIRMETRQTNHHAITFYTRCGYEITKPYGRYIGRTDAVCFAKHL